MMRYATILLAIFLAGPGCPPPTNDPPAPTPPAPPDTDKCAAACANMTKLKCDLAEPITMPGGNTVTCEQFCRDTQNQGVPLNPTCVATVTSCADVDTKCRVGRERF